ncbi:MAG: RNA polymerase sigma factor [Cyclobacteriaceae bacterium]|nr:RNA polymerase sigma factor [Cyclobacteriaceae bacterium]
MQPLAKVNVYKIVQANIVEATSKNIHGDLIDKCLHGDRKSYEKIYKLYSKAMYNVSYRILHDEAEAEDILQESFVSAFKNLHNFKQEATFGSWLKRIVVNNSINALRKRKLEFEDVDENIKLPEDEKFDLDEHMMQVNIVKSAIKDLPDGYRLVFSLYMLEGYDHIEISNILGISESTSKSQFNRSKKKLKELIKKRYEKG